MKRGPTYLIADIEKWSTERIEEEIAKLSKERAARAERMQPIAAKYKAQVEDLVSTPPGREHDKKIKQCDATKELLDEEERWQSDCRVAVHNLMHVVEARKRAVSANCPAVGEVKEPGHKRPLGARVEPVEDEDEITEDDLLFFDLMDDD